MTIAPLPDLLPGEDRSFGTGLFVDLIPRSCWFTNVRYCVAPSDWDRIRKMVYRRAGWKCEACGARPDRARKQWLEAHERWAYLPDGPAALRADRPVQKLVRLIALCTACHEVTHYGRAEVMGNGARALVHYMDITGMDLSDAEMHIEVAFEVWAMRGHVDWDLDVSMLTDVGITIVRPAPRSVRAAIADRRLAGGE